LSSTTSTRAALLWSFAERYANLLITIGGIVILSRLLTPAQVGVYSLCAAVGVVAGILRDFGISEYLIQEKELTRERIRTALGIAIIIAWVVGLAIFLSRDAMAAYYQEPGVSVVLAILSLNFLLLPFSSPAYALLSREMAFRKLFILQFSSNAVATSIGIALAWQGFGFVSLAWMPVANIATQTLLMFALRPQNSRVWPGLSEVRRVLDFGWMFVTTRFLEVFSRNVHEPVVAKQFGFEPVGLFSRAYGLVEIFNANLISAIVQVATPMFAADSRAGRPVAEPFVNATALLTGVTWPFFCFVALMSEEVIRLMFGPQWVSAANLASILALTAIVGSSFALVPQLLSATGHVKQRMVINIWAAALHVVCVFVAVTISLEAVACVWFVSSSAKLAMYLTQLRKLYGLSPWRFLSRCGISGVVTLAASAGVWAGAAACRQIGGAAAWWIGARAISHPALIEVSRLVGGVRNKLTRRSATPAP
jgi:O-antigen/teichoic acid export membrane protein